MNTPSISFFYEAMVFLASLLSGRGRGCSLVLVFLSIVISQAAASASVTVSPANTTDTLTQQFGSVRFILSDSNISNAVVVNLAPLTPALANVTWPFFQVRISSHFPLVLPRLFERLF